MIDVEVALTAGRKLSVDVANLSFRLALVESERELLQQMVLQLTPGTWRRSMEATEPGAEKSETVAVVMISGEQVAVLDQILSTLQALV